MLFGTFRRRSVRGQALDDLRNALLDGEVRARFCSIPEPLPRGVYRVPDLIEPVPERFWQDCIIFPFGDGYVVPTTVFASPLDKDYQNLPKRRGVVLDYDQVNKNWPAPAGVEKEERRVELAYCSFGSCVSRANSDAATSNLPARGVSPQHRQGGDVVETALRTIQKQASRKIVRDILKEREFAELRRPRGRPSR